MEAKTPTREEVKSALGIITAVADAIRELGSVPSGHLYAQVMTHLTLAQFEQVIDRLKGAGLVSEKNHLLTWVGAK